MRASAFDRMTRTGDYRRIGMFALPTGQVYLAEKINHTPDGVQFDTLWAAGPDGDHLDIGQKITFNWNTTKEARTQHALLKATEFLAMREYIGDPKR